MFLVNIHCIVNEKKNKRRAKLKKKINLEQRGVSSETINLFVWGFSSQSRIFHSFWDVTITAERLLLTYAHNLINMTIEQWGFFSVPHLLWHGTSVYNSHPRGSVTLIHIAEHLAVWTCLNDLGLSRLEFEHPSFRLHCERSNRNNQ